MTLHRFSCLAAALLLAAPATLAAETTPPREVPATQLDPSASFKEVDLKSLVRTARTDVPGQRVIFAPSPLKFRAALSALPAPQKTDYLMSALSMMRVSSPPKVSQRIGLDYGGDKALAAYIEDAVATRLAKEVKVGQSRTFYAFHVYNHATGPALLVTSFAD